MVDLSDDEGETGSDSRILSNASSSIPGAFIGDIQERLSTLPPTAPKLKTTSLGFPEHKKRVRVSAFKQQRGQAATPAAKDITKDSALPHKAPSTVTNNSRNHIGEAERTQIDRENRKRLESMSAEEIDEERQEIMAALDPSLIERLLKRANLDEARGDTGIEQPSTELLKDEEKELRHNKIVHEEGAPVRAPQPRGKQVTLPKSVRFDDDAAPNEPVDLHPISQFPNVTSTDMLQPLIHFPVAPSAPDLDPSDPEFFENLHTKYFPSLPTDPSKLAWMAPVPTHGSLADQESPYYPGQENLPVSALRFGFRGGILPPRIARAVPATRGLHHHGEAPEAAGYTIPELTRLSRSAFPSQRCMAFQTLGRVLYRLGRGLFKQANDALDEGIWKCIDENKIISILQEAASGDGGHQASRAHAIDALWLWQKGGGKVWKAS